ncbi:MULTISPECIES: hypothetical protein [unclassified Streptomyces]|uniref:hypothetical protein n=1 Tax=unclassified Streptomyces TaxID=2593676 RepID=UPI002E181EB8|nr:MULTISPECIES: hypothetical protein [unclassified Streptomyces]
MNADLITAAALAAPGALLAAIAFTGHARAHRADDALAAALKESTPAPIGPGGPGEPQPLPEPTAPLAPVIDLFQRCPTTPHASEEDTA